MPVEAVTEGTLGSPAPSPAGSRGSSFAEGAGAGLVPSFSGAKPESLRRKGGFHPHQRVLDMLRAFGKPPIPSAWWATPRSTPGLSRILSP